MSEKKRRLKIFLLIVACQFWIFTHASAQSNVFNKYGLLVINNIKNFRETVFIDSNKKLLSLRKCLPNIILDLRYASTDNFMHQKLYPSIQTSYLRMPAIQALQQVFEFLRRKNLTIKVFDAYRPYAVTEKMWEIVRDDRYAADPSKGSGHNRGITIDLTLVNLATQKELPMGTGFDNFTDTAHTDFKNLPADVLNNRNMLTSTMEKFGFTGLATEWWHFSFANASSFELLDLTFDELETIDINN